MEPRIVNITLVVNLKTNLDLKSIARTSVNIEYYDQPFRRCVKRFGRKATLLIYRSGKMICLARSLKVGHKAIEKFRWELVKMGFHAKNSLIKTENIVAKSEIDTELDLNEVDNLLGRMVQYNKEIFPNLRYTSTRNPKAKVIVSTGGKLVFTGVKSVEELNQLNQEFHDIITPILAQVAYVSENEDN